MQMHACEYTWTYKGNRKRNRHRHRHTLTKLCAMEWHLTWSACLLCLFNGYRMWHKMLAAMFPFLDKPYLQQIGTIHLVLQYTDLNHTGIMLTGTTSLKRLHAEGNNSCQNVWHNFFHRLLVTRNLCLRSNLDASKMDSDVSGSQNQWCNHENSYWLGLLIRVMRHADLPLKWRGI